jgi:hypothetical protein
MSEVKLRAKVALQQAGVIAAPTAAMPSKSDGSPGTAIGAASSPAASITARQAAANLKRDAKAADAAPAAVGNGRETPVQRVLQEPETLVSNEGANLLKGTRAE